jgi:hypothetical protein
MTSPLPDFVRRIISGGQTGVDRGALDAAIALGVDHGGWCPKGRLAEDGFIPARYKLRETDSSDYPQRTEQNVVDSDGTLILFRPPLQGGTELTRRLARRHRKPCLLVDLAVEFDAGRVSAWIRRHRIQVLNVAGPRESTAPGIAREAERLLAALLRTRRMVDERPAVGEYENAATPEASEDR